MFIAAQFKMAKYWKQPKCPSVNEWIKKTMVHLHNGILCSRKKEGAPTLCNSMDGTGKHYAKPIWMAFMSSCLLWLGLPVLTE